MNNQNILFCSVGRRTRLLIDFRESMKGCGKIVATDMSPLAPALFFADEVYLAPRITAPDYFERVLEICKKSDVKAITTLIDPEIEIYTDGNDYTNYKFSEGDILKVELKEGKVIKVLDEMVYMIFNEGKKKIKKWIWTSTSLKIVKMHKKEDEENKENFDEK